MTITVNFQIHLFVITSEFLCWEFHADHGGALGFYKSKISKISQSTPLGTIQVPLFLICLENNPLYSYSNSPTFDPTDIPTRIFNPHSCTSALCEESTKSNNGQVHSGSSIFPGALF